MLGIAKNSIMDNILQKAVPCNPDDRALVLEKDTELERVHTAMAHLGQTPLPERPDEDIDNQCTKYIT